MIRWGICREISTGNGSQAMFLNFFDSFASNMHKMRQGSPIDYMSASLNRSLQDSTFAKNARPSILILCICVWVQTKAQQRTIAYIQTAHSTQKNLGQYIHSIVTYTLFILITHTQPNVQTHVNPHNQIGWCWSNTCASVVFHAIGTAMQNLAIHIYHLLT